MYRTYDFRTNEFRGLTGGAEFEAQEENPMIGFRGAYRYVTDPELFRLELDTIAQVRAETPNLSNPTVYLGIGVLLCAQAALVYWPPMYRIFGTAPLTWREIAHAALVGAFILPLVSLEKLVRRHHNTAFQAVRRSRNSG